NSLAADGLAAHFGVGPGIDHRVLQFCDGEPGQQRGAGDSRGAGHEAAAGELGHVNLAGITSCPGWWILYPPTLLSGKRRQVKRNAKASSRGSLPPCLWSWFDDCIFASIEFESASALLQRRSPRRVQASGRVQ